jgi:hypothetical protein
MGVLLPDLPACFTSGCMVGPSTSARPLALRLKEPPPDGWKEARPCDGVIRGIGGRSITIGAQRP